MIKFDKPKLRQKFLRDIVTLNIALALVEVGIKGDDFAGELVVLHKNRDRKDLKKVKDKLDKLKIVRLKIFEQLELRDIEAIEGLGKRFFKDFVQTLKYTGQINLENLAIQLINHKFGNRDSNDLHDSLHVFTRSWGIHAITGVLKNNDIYCTDLEINLAINLANKIKRI